jgi:hypothetical protein
VGQPAKNQMITIRKTPSTRSSVLWDGATRRWAGR